MRLGGISCCYFLLLIYFILASLPVPTESSGAEGTVVPGSSARRGERISRNYIGPYLLRTFEWGE